MWRLVGWLGVEEEAVVAVGVAAAEQDWAT